MRLQEEGNVSLGYARTDGKAELRRREALLQKAILLFWPRPSTSAIRLSRIPFAVLVFMDASK